MAASALYACTKCTQRYPFEELSQGQQLCKVGGHRALGAPIRSGSRASGGRDRGDCVPPARMLGPGPPRSAVSDGAEPGGHQSTTSQRPDADSDLTPALSEAALSFHWEAGRPVCTFLLGTRTRTRTCRADGILLPVPESEATGLGTRCSDLELLPSHKSWDAVCEPPHKIDVQSNTCNRPWKSVLTASLIYVFHIPHVQYR